MIAKLQNFSDRDSTDVTLLEDGDYLTEIKERSEAYLYDILQKLYPSHIVKWLNYNSDTRSFNESYQHHDFEILDNNRNVVHYIDCKATPHQKRTFYLTTNEWDFFLDCVAKRKSYQIYRVFNLT
ncbi:DUF3883 domain-containing protein [Bernardetia sp. Wsw4-3y2]|uniref:protein NO VEIN domain-containing protein n=1 Tax=Bernardetia sp. Wsw4-3y2 TaxID=3127471 RepID=UPI0030CB34C1